MDTIKKTLALLITALLFLGTTAQAAVNVQVFQITNDSSQQNDPLVYENLVAYTNWGGSQGINIWGYNLKTKSNFPIIAKPGQQFLDGLYKNLLVYEDFNNTTQKYAIHLYSLTSSKDTLVTPGLSTYESGSTNGSDVIYIDGGVCGKLMDYKIASKQTKQLADPVCVPKMSGQHIVWVCKTQIGQAICLYNLDTDKTSYLGNNTNSKDTPNITGNQVVWEEYDGTNYQIELQNIKSGHETSIISTAQYVNYPAVYGRFVVWGQSPSVHAGQAGIEGYDLKTTQTFEIFPQGPQQNTNITPQIWGNTVVWQAWRTGNGDIYGATLNP